MRLLPLLALTVALAGCGGSAADGTATAPAENPGAPAERPAGSKPANTVTMKDISFKPGNVDVKVGKTVRWVNEDQVEHNVVATQGADFKSPLFGKDGVYTYKTTQAGTIRFECTVHPGMEGTITVK